MDNGGVFVLLLLIFNVHKKLFIVIILLCCPFLPLNKTICSFSCFFNQVLIVRNIFYFNEPKTDNKDDGIPVMPVSSSC
jgi:hypothetical protein